MTQKGANAAIARLDKAFTETEAAFSAALPSVPDMRQRAAHITRAGDRIDAEFAKRLDYGAMRVSARRLTSDAAAQIQPVEAAHRRLRRRLFWQLVWAKYRSVVWGLFGLAVVAGGGWALWHWRVEIVGFFLSLAQTQPVSPAPAAPGPLQGQWGPQ